MMSVEIVAVTLHLQNSSKALQLSEVRLPSNGRGGWWRVSQVTLSPGQQQREGLKLNVYIFEKNPIQVFEVGAFPKLICLRVANTQRWTVCASCVRQNNMR